MAIISSPGKIDHAGQVAGTREISTEVISDMFSCPEWKTALVNNLEATKPLFGYKNLIARQKSDNLAHLVYDLTVLLPKEELFGITSQLRRAVLSVPTNIVEGYARNNKKEFHRFLIISLGSLAETTFLLEFAQKRGLINPEDYEKVSRLREEVGRILWKLYISQE